MKQPYKPEDFTWQEIIAEYMCDMYYFCHLNYRYQDDFGYEEEYNKENIRYIECSVYDSTIELGRTYIHVGFHDEVEYPIKQHTSHFLLHGIKTLLKKYNVSSHEADGLSIKMRTTKEKTFAYLTDDWDYGKIYIHIPTRSWKDDINLTIDIDILKGIEDRLEERRNKDED